MVGKWYEVERSFYLMEMSSSCTELRVTLNDRRQLDIIIHTRNRWWVTYIKSFDVIGIGNAYFTGALVFLHSPSFLAVSLPLILHDVYEM